MWIASEGVRQTRPFPGEKLFSASNILGDDLNIRHVHARLVTENFFVESYLAECASFLSFSPLHLLLLQMPTSSSNIPFQGDRLLRIRR